jgi:membrane protein YqaA with SNARE-associated domain
MREFATSLVDALVELGPWGLFLLAFVDSSFVPLPQAVDALVVAGAIAAPNTAYSGAALAVAGSLVGSLVLYALARAGGRFVIERRVSVKLLEGMRQRIERYGAFVLFPPTMIPIPLPMAPFVLAAGMFRMNLYHFSAVIVFARLVRYMGEAFIALRYGDATLEILRERTATAILIALVLAAVFYAVHRLSVVRLSRNGR